MYCFKETNSYMVIPSSGSFYMKLSHVNIYTDNENVLYFAFTG